MTVMTHSRSLRPATLLTLAVACTGCTRSPTLSIFGSFFPTWLPIALLGIVFAVVVRAVCVARHWNEALPVPVLFYAACAAIFIFGAYLVWLA